MDLWNNLKTGPSVPKLVYAVVEIPKNSQNKYEYDVKKEKFSLDWVLDSPFYFPADYGFIPRTLGDDGDPMDILVIIDQPTFPGCVIKVRPIGVLRMMDEDEKDDKILAVPVKDPSSRNIKDLADVPTALLDEIQQFFADFKKSLSKVEIIGWKDKKEAFRVIKLSMDLYNKRSSIRSLFLLD